MSARIQSIAAAGVILALASGAGAAAPIVVPLDTETTVNGVPVACTGVGEAKLNPHWDTYPVRVEFSGANNELLADEALTIFDEGGAEVVSVACEGPWILLKLPPGSYRIEGRLSKVEARPQSGYFKVTPDGPVHLELRFPDA
jgi:hypothetical protein